MRGTGLALVGLGLFLAYQNSQLQPGDRVDAAGIGVVKVGFLLLVAGEIQGRLG